MSKNKERFVTTISFGVVVIIGFFGVYSTLHHHSEYATAGFKEVSPDGDCAVSYSDICLAKTAIFNFISVPAVGSDGLETDILVVPGDFAFDQKYAAGFFGHYPVEE